mgnify:CR=1 FL=1
MRVEKQGEFECMLATIAALADTSLSDVRTRACQLAGIDQWRQIEGTARYWSAVDKLISEYKVLGVPTGQEYPRRYSPPSSDTNWKLPAVGKGSVAFQYTNTPTTHICPFEDGLVYDPSYPSHPRTLAKALLHLGKHWRVIGIWVAEDSVTEL